MCLETRVESHTVVYCISASGFDLFILAQRLAELDLWPLRDGRDFFREDVWRLAEATCQKQTKLPVRVLARGSHPQ